MSDAPVQHWPDSISPETALFLQQFTAQSDAPYVHTYPISFYNGIDRQNWSAPHEGKKVWIGLFSVPTSNWIKDPEWDSTPWHIWGAASLRPESGQGKYLIIWDCDPRDPFKPDGTIKRPKGFLLNAQAQLLQWLRHTPKVKLLGLFYHNDPSQSGQDQCLQHTCDWIQRMVEFGDGYFRGFDEQGNSLDPRTRDCVYMTRW